MNNSVRLLPDTANEKNKVGTPVLAQLYSSSHDGQYTVGIYATEFVGRIVIEASLEGSKDNDAWFPIITSQDEPFYQFTEFDKGNGLYTFNFEGNFNWIRARMTRDYIFPEPNPSEVGSINKVMLNR